MFDLLHRAFHEPGTRAYRWVDGVVWVLIAISIGLFTAEVVLGTLPFPAITSVLDTAILAAFGLELALRVISFRPPGTGFYDRTPGQEIWAQIRGRVIFMLDPLNLVDLAVVFAAYPALRGLRALRLLRLARAVRWFRYANPITDTMQAFRANRLLYNAAFAFLGVLTLVGGLSLYLVERQANDNLHTVADGLWWAIVTLTTVGFGDISPQTALGRVIGAALMIAGMFTLALFAGVVGNTLLGAILRIREEQFRMSNTVGHVIVMGYDAGSRRLLDALVEEYAGRVPIVVFTESQRPARVPESVEWVNGDPKRESELDKARLAHARGVVVVGKRGLTPEQADAETLLTLFTVRRFMGQQQVARRQPLYLVAEILDAENVEHATSAGADEVIETSRLGFSMLAHAVAQPGTASVMSRVASAGAHNLYVGALPPGMQAPVSYGEVFDAVRAQGHALIIGVRDRRTGEDRLNPPEDTVVDGNVDLVYLAERAVLPEPG